VCLDEVYSSWSEFAKIVQTEIFPIYTSHEEKFDQYGIHGKMHISRALIFAEVLSRCYLSLGVTVDLLAVRLSTAFHDSGRQGNGTDIWENESVKICETHLMSRCDDKYRSYIASLISKSTGEWDVNKHIMHDADVLEIMRPCAGHGGISGFQRRYLNFASDRDPYFALFTDPITTREKLINESWKFIYKTENIKSGLVNSKHYLEDVTSILKNHLLELSFLNSYFP